MSERRNEIFIERFCVAESRNGAGFIASIGPANVRFTPDLRQAQRFATKNDVVAALEKGITGKPIGERDARNYRIFGAWAQFGLGAPPKGSNTNGRD